MPLPEDYDPRLDDIPVCNGRPMHYKLVDRIAVPCSLRQWVEYMETAGGPRIVQDVVTRADSDPVSVSTIFLGMDHNHWGDGPPILFETMVFGGPLDQHQVRYTTYGEAVRGHAELLEDVKTEGELTSDLIRARISAILLRAVDIHQPTDEE